MQFSSPVSSLPGIGPVLAGKLAKLDIHTVFDLLYHLPFRYADRSQISTANAVQPGETVTLIGTLSAFSQAFTKKGKNFQSATFADSSASLPVIWFNQPFLSRTFKGPTPIALHGKVDFFNHRPTLISPDYELVRTAPDQLLHTNRLVPVYPETLGVSSKLLRTKIHHLLHALDLSDFYPPPHSLPDLKTALLQVHFPTSLAQVDLSRRRLAFDEVLLLQLTALLRKQRWLTTQLAHPFSIDQSAVSAFIASLPFSLTSSQNQAISDLLSDLGQPHPANRLLQGDVGSGKTVVAAVAAYVAHLNGFQTLFMAPTQILAHQHHQTLTGLFRQVGLSVGLITSASSAKHQASASPVVVGTHALLSPHLSYSQVGLIVIDEQHRFGVAQRALATRLGRSPHILTMTATPIPRTVALTLYGDLDLSTLTEMPSGRKSVKTWLVPEAKRSSAYTWIAEQISTHTTQAFIVCPFIQDSETLTTVKSAQTEFHRLQQLYPQFKLGLLHGKLSATAKQDVINSFRAGDTHILVTTPVVEVGIDIPNATIMLVEGADRFGLAQLHQLRGRVGRSHLQSYCLLFSDTPDSPRLKSLEHHHSGQALAEIDLQLRGPGQIYGTAQHGFPEFKVASYTDLALIKSATDHAQSLLPHLSRHPVLLSLIKEDKISLVQPN